MANDLLPELHTMITMALHTRGEERERHLKRADLFLRRLMAGISAPACWARSYTRDGDEETGLEGRGA